MQILNDLKDTFAKFTFALAIQEKGKFPAQPQSNSKSFQNTQSDANPTRTTPCEPTNELDSPGKPLRFGMKD